MSYNTKWKPKYHSIAAWLRQPWPVRSNKVIRYACVTYGAVWQTTGVRHTHMHVCLYVCGCNNELLPNVVACSYVIKSGPGWCMVLSLGWFGSDSTGTNLSTCSQSGVVSSVVCCFSILPEASVSLSDCRVPCFICNIHVYTVCWKQPSVLNISTCQIIHVKFYF